LALAVQFLTPNQDSVGSVSIVFQGNCLLYLIQENFGFGCLSGTGLLHPGPGSNYLKKLPWDK